MKTQSIRWFAILTTSSLLISCDGDQDEKVGQRNDGRGSSLSTRPTSLSDKEMTERSRSALAEGHWSKLSKMTTLEEKREFFSDSFFDLPPEDHEIAVEAVIEDSKVENSANLIEEYLEMSSFMESALQLPGIVRILEEGKFSELQRLAMENHLREEIGLSKDREVTDWRALVEEHLGKNPALLRE